MEGSWRHADMSFWEQETFFGPFDVVIVGSGIVGLSTTIELLSREPSARVAILERGAIPIGASTRNAGFACIGSPTELLDDIRTSGTEACKNILRLRWEGLNMLRNRLGDEQLGYNPTGGYEVFFEEDDHTAKIVLERRHELNALIHEATGEANVYSLVDQPAKKFGIPGVNVAIKSALEGQIHPGKMVAGLLRKAAALGAMLFTNTELTGFAQDGDHIKLTLSTGKDVTTSKLLLATNGFSRRLLPDLDVVPARNTVLVTDPIEGMKINGCFHYDRGYVYFRNIGNRLLLGGGRNMYPEAEYTEDFGTNPDIRQFLENFLTERLLPGTKVGIRSSWSGILGVGESKGPLVRPVSPGVYIAVRMGGMGIAIGSAIGKQASDMLLQSTSASP